MITFVARRFRNAIITLVAAAIIFVLYQASVVAFLPTHYYTGWLLLALMIFLALYNTKKKLPFLPSWGKSSSWLQLHLYLGVLTIFIFTLHVQFRVPDGLFEGLMSLVYLGVIVTGILGIYISRRFPSRLTAHGETVLYERIPVLRRQIRDETQKMIFNDLEKNEATTLAEFYSNKILPFLMGPRNTLWHLVGSKHHYRKMLTEMDVVEPYLNSREKEIFSALKEYVDAKENLDHQFALQCALKWWLFLHIPLTYSLILFLAVHVIVVHAY